MAFRSDSPAAALPADVAPAARSRRAKGRASAVRLLAGVVVLLAVGLANCVGRTVVEPDVAASIRSRGRELVVIQTSQAGWPIPFVAVHGQDVWPLTALEQGVHWISLLALAVDVALGLAAVVGGAWLLAIWLGGRRRLLQFGLLDLLLLVSAVGLYLGYGYLPRAAHLADERTVADLEPHAPAKGRARYRPQVERRIVWQPGRLEWLRQLGGERWLPDTGRVIAADVYGADVRYLPRLDRLRVVRIYGSVTDRELGGLRGLDELECLDLGSASLRKDHGGWIDTPDPAADFPIPLAQLRRLYAPNNVLQGSDLAGCTSLVELDLSGTQIDLASAHTLAGLGRLRILDLHDTRLNDEMLGRLAELPRLEMLDLSQTAVTDAGLAHLARLPSLHSVWLSSTAITDHGLADLARCPKLETVRLTGSRVTSNGISRLSTALPDCTVVY